MSLSLPDKILAVLPEDFDLGFKLTGIDTQACASAESARAYLEKELTQQKYSVILIDENFIFEFDSRFNKKIQSVTKPLIMAVPLKRSFKEEARPKDYFLKMVQDAIGYEIRIR